MLAEDNVRSGFLDDAGYLQLRPELPDYLLPIFVVAYRLGNRIGELRRLLWTQVDFANDQNPLEPRHNEKQKGADAPYLRGYARAAADGEGDSRHAIPKMFLRLPPRWPRNCGLSQGLGLGLGLQTSRRTRAAVSRPAPVGDPEHALSRHPGSASNVLN
jgi:hypothetical protein